MAKISITLPDELVNYLDQKVPDKNTLITTILQQWREQQEIEEMAQASTIVDQLELGCTEEWETAAIIDITSQPETPQHQLNQLKGKIKAFQEINPVAWQKKIRGEWDETRLSDGY